MGTEYSSLHQYIRTILGDDDPEAYLYSADVLNAQLNWVSIQLNDLTIVGNEDSLTFTNDLTSVQKGIVSTKVAMNIIAPQNNEFRYSSPILSVSRVGGVNKLYLHIQQMYDALTGGTMAIATDQFLAAYINNVFRYADDLTDATSASNR